MGMEKFLIDKFFSLTNFNNRGLFVDCQYVWQPLAKLEGFFKEKLAGKIEYEVPEGVTLIHPETIQIGKGTIIEPGAYICGPCVIGEDCQIRHGAYIRGFVITGSRCVIGNSTEIKNSILLDDVCAAHFNYIGDSILGNRVNLGAGVKLANLRLDHTEILVSDGEKKVQTHLKKLGAILGDDVQLGCNAVTNPGTIIGKHARCFPCLAIGGYIPPRAKIRSTQKMVVEDHVNRSCF